MSDDSEHYRDDETAGEWDRRRAPSEGLRCVPDNASQPGEHASGRLKIRAYHHVASTC